MDFRNGGDDDDDDQAGALTLAAGRSATQVAGTVTRRGRMQMRAWAELKRVAAAAAALKKERSSSRAGFETRRCRR